MADVKIVKKNEVHMQLICEPYILYEMQEYFTFDVPGKKFMPQYRSKYWDGKIRLLSVHTGEIYVGLLDKIIEKLKRHNYTYEFVNNKYYGLPFELNENVSQEGLKDYMNCICSSDRKPRDYQIQSVYDCLKYNRRLMISPTSSGKSLMMYSIIRYFTESNKKTLLIVPTTSLVEQIVKEFNAYGWNADDYCHKIYTGKEKITNSSVVVSTWQSIYQLNKSWFENFDVVIGDECLTPDTLITMEDGSQKQIKDIKIGEKVITFNEKTKTKEAKKVKKVHKNISKNQKLFKISLSDGNFVKITGNHKVLLTSGIWKRVDELVIGDTINSIE